MSSLTERLEAHARLHDAFYPPDEEQTQWAADLRKAIVAIHQRDAALRECKLLTHMVITCGIAASHPDANLTRTGVYADEWNSQQAEEVRALRADRDELARQRGELAARVIELQAHNDSIRMGARAVVAHWDEFGPEHGFDEAIDVLRRQLGALAANVIEPQATVTEDDLFTLIGHAEGLLAEGQHDMPTYFYGLVCRLARIVGGGELTQRMEKLRASRVVNVASDSQPSEMTE